MQNQKLTAYILLLITAAIWGTGGVIIKYTLDFITPFSFLFWRFFITSIVSIPLFIWYLKKHPLSLNWIPKITILAMVGTVINLVFIFFGFQKTSAMEGTLLTSISPIFIVIGSVLFLKERLSRRGQIGVAIALAGTVITILEPLIVEGFSKGESPLIGNLLLLGANISWMIFVVLSKYWENNGLKPFHLVAISSFIGLVCFAPAALFEHILLAKPYSELLEIPQQAIMGIFYMAILASLVAYSTYTLALSKIDASEASLFHYLNPVFATPIAALWLGEKITATFLLGALIIGIGISLAEYNKSFFTKLHSYHFTHRK